MRFEWDAKKEIQSRRKHGVSFIEAREALESDERLDLFDEAHSADEDRFITIARISKGVLLVVWTERHEDVVRIISAR